MKEKITDVIAALFIVAALTGILLLAACEGGPAVKVCGEYKGVEG